MDEGSKLSEGLKQALFLTKSVIVEKGLPSKILDLAESAATTEQDELVIQVIRLNDYHGYGKFYQGK